jgi:hypothetical protein
MFCLRPFSDLLETFMLHNVAILPSRRVSGKLLPLFLVSVPAGVNDFYQMTVSCRDALSEVTNFTVLEDFEMLV